MSDLRKTVYVCEINSILFIILLLPGCSNQLLKDEFKFVRSWNFQELTRSVILTALAAYTQQFDQ